MATEKRLIYMDDTMDRLRAYAERKHQAGHTELANGILKAVNYIHNEISRVDAIPVDEIKLRRIIIDNEGVPEVKLQIGDRYFILRTDPVDVREVVHGRWIPVIDEPTPLRKCAMLVGYECSVCGRFEDEEEPYCNCGAKMDGDGK